MAATARGTYDDKREQLGKVQLAAEDCAVVACAREPYPCALQTLPAKFGPLVVSDPLDSNLLAGSTASGLCQVLDEFTHHAVANGAPMEFCHDCFRLATFLSRCGSMHDHFEVILV